MRLGFLLLVSMVASACATDVEPAFEIGFVASDQFSPINDNDPCPVVDAIQGGYWVMPTLRVAGLSETNYVECSLTRLSDSFELGRSLGDRRFTKAGEWDEHRFLLNLVEIRNGDDYSALDDEVGQLACEVRNDDVSLTVSNTVNLVSVSLGTRSKKLAVFPPGFSETNNAGRTQLGEIR